MAGISAGHNVLPLAVRSRDEPRFSRVSGPRARLLFCGGFQMTKLNGWKVASVL